MVRKDESPSMSFKNFDWKRMVIGLRKPAVAVIGFALTQAASYPQWAWLSGLSAAAIWGTVEFYVSKV